MPHFLHFTVDQCLIFASILLPISLALLLLSEETDASDRPVDPGSPEMTEPPTDTTSMPVGFPFLDLYLRPEDIFPILIVLF
jgi:hypothetical protein